MNDNVPKKTNQEDQVSTATEDEVGPNRRKLKFLLWQKQNHWYLLRQSFIVGLISYLFLYLTPPESSR